MENNNHHQCSCRHNPSSKTTQWKIYWDFLIHRKSLYNRHTYTTMCAYCGKTITAPACFFKKAPWRTLSLGFSYASLAVAGGKLLFKHTNVPVICILGLSVILAIFLRHLLKRMLVASLLSFEKWEEVSKTNEEEMLMQNNLRSFVIKTEINEIIGALIGGFAAICAL